MQKLGRYIIEDGVAYRFPREVRRAMREQMRELAAKHYGTQVTLTDEHGVEYRKRVSASTVAILAEIKRRRDAEHAAKDSEKSA